MSVIPVRDIEQIIFGEQHWPVWITAPTTVGLTVAQVNAIKASVNSARAAYDAAQAA